MKCPNCGQPVDEQDIFCGECGTKLKDPSTDKSASSTDKDKAHTQAETSNTSQEHKEHLVKTDNEQHATHRYDQEGTTSNQARSESQNHHQAQDHQPQDNKQATYKQRPHQNNSYQQNNSQPTQNHHTNSQSSQNHHTNSQSSQNQQPQGPDFKQHSTDIFNEMKDFFRTAFTRPDQIISSSKSFSAKTLVTLLVAGFIVTAVFLAIMIPEGFLETFLQTEKSSAIGSFIFALFIGLIILFFVTYLLLRMINVNIPLQKFLSDFVLINTIPVVLFLIGCLLVRMHAFTVAITILILSLLMLMVTPVYLMTKNSHQYQLRMPVIYAILIYFLIVAFILRIFVESFITDSIGSAADALDGIFDQSSGGY
ncbi:zinc ribbon domain-containing protein [Staphylococcus pettenkoferi]|uniref:zinc ribbon domain-containing protein n=1 Tax=Staphylococcus pettenkoferi TaxID=170573 RepID=UPI0011A8A4BF|nr:zinc ribbon domain-containing protein [Staphylococcus pettenkoferi]MCY1568119.1 zinc ribbon domain-containing protein [Staphylococcus pettenkoferi]MCY1587251.1 zinc ribbon domain-containing protein [Staphylococcus pettenkoferi]